MRIRILTLEIALQFLVTVIASAQNPEICASVTSLEARTGGEFVTSFGTIKALFVFIDFPDDTYDPNNATWPVGTGPNFLNSITDASEAQHSGTYANVTTFFRDQSWGQFTMIGQGYYVQAPHPLSYYTSAYPGNEASRSAADAIQDLDQSVDFSDFDRWTDSPYSHTAGADGVLDMVFICYRIWYINRGLYGSSFIAEGWYNASLPNSSVSVDNGGRSIQGSHAVDVLNMIQYPRFEHLVHEFGHVWGLNHQYAPGMWSLMGQRQPTVSSFMNSLERVQLGWTSFSTPADGQTYYLRDFGSTGDAYRIAVPNTNPQEYFIVENHQDLSPYDLPDATGAKGIYILQNAPTVEPNGIEGTLRVVPADGRWNWSVPYWIQNPWNPNQPNDLIPVFQRGAAGSVSGSSDHDVIYASNPNSIHDGYNMMFAWLDETTGNEIHGPRFKGDGLDRWAASEVSLFSPGSNPPSCSINGTQTTIAIQVESPSGNTIPVKFYLTNPPYYSAPKNLVFVNANTDRQYPQLTWSANPEPLVAGYDIWRRFRNTSQGIDVTQRIAHLYAGTSYTDYDYLTASSSQYYSTLYYWIYAGDSAGNLSSSSPQVSSMAFSQQTGKNPSNGGAAASLPQATPTQYSVGTYPNPFNPSTTISYQLIEDARVELQVFDLVGRMVAILVDGERSAGYQSVIWNGRDESGRNAASGIYFYRFVATPLSGAKPFVGSGKLLLLK